MGLYSGGTGEGGAYIRGGASIWGVNWVTYLGGVYSGRGGLYTGGGAH